VQLVDGAHHITFLTEGLRHAFPKVGPTTVLHAFQMLEATGPPPPSPMFSRGRLDHFALLAPSEEAFRELRRRIEVEGAADGDVRDMTRVSPFQPDFVSSSRSTRFSSTALVATMIELSDIRSADHSGRSSIP
jgi:hypothetical protein